jgi:hypothetical protein
MSALEQALVGQRGRASRRSRRWMRRPRWRIVAALLVGGLDLFWRMERSSPDMVQL